MKDTESALKDAESALKDAESAMDKAIIAAYRSGSGSPLPSDSIANISFDVGAARECLSQIQQGRGRLLKLPDTSSTALNKAMCRARNFSALFEVYDEVVPSRFCAIMKMKDCWVSVCERNGFNVWTHLSAAKKHTSLNQVVLGLVRLCRAGWVNYDCRLANIVIDKDGNLTAIDLDWIQQVDEFKPPSTQASSLWYPPCLKPMLYLAWQAYLSAKLLLECSSLSHLQECRASLDKGDQDWGGCSFEEFEQHMNKSG